MRPFRHVGGGSRCQIGALPGREGSDLGSGATEWRCVFVIVSREEDTPVNFFFPSHLQMSVRGMRRCPDHSYGNALF